LMLPQAHKDRDAAERGLAVPRKAAAADLAQQSAAALCGGAASLARYVAGACVEWICLSWPKSHCVDAGVLELARLL
jgi:hypothetical protein